MSTNYNTCFIDSNGKDVSEEFVEKSYLLDVYINLLEENKLPLIYGWGALGYGGRGDNVGGITRNFSSPVQAVSGSTYWRTLPEPSQDRGTAAIKSDGTLWGWGINADALLGNNTIINASSPVQTISGGTNWKQISQSSNHMVAVKTDGTLWSWGTGYAGTNVNCFNYSSPVQTVSGGTNWKQGSSGGDNNGGIKTDGTLWLWGTQGTWGAFGNNSTIARSSPVQTVSGGTNWKQLSISGSADIVAAVKTDGTLWLWGYNATGSLGNNNVISRSSPVQTVSGGTNWKQVAISGSVTAAIKRDGTLWTWGFNSQGGVGDNTVIPRSSPVQTVSGGTNWKQLSVGPNHMSSIKTDGSLWSWGLNTSGQLGDNTVISKSSPVQEISGSTSWRQVSVGLTATFALSEGDW